MFNYILVVLVIGFFLYLLKALDKYNLSLNAENKEFEYTLFILQKNGIEEVVYFYSDFERYTVDHLMDYLWHERLNAYVLKEKGRRKILCPLSELYYCESFVERNTKK
ncbi:hypothetical protein P0E64_08795 [Enterococcus faecalis]|uniref:hypothetical protein n=1 Tax=Enterococcus faecalis TaxID=1351 RepID=UPI00192880D0|nr:hypothetical protein [Enterococcus faecalis]EHQ8840348.1 hypothetical protein [Enterococcus faecalis]MDN3125207.1 hypothetical protein [Enterococcus faecalis]